MNPLLKHIRYGIHTFSVYMTLTGAEYHAVKHCCVSLRLLCEDYWSKKQSYYIDIFEDQGLKLYLSHAGNIYTLKIRIEPCKVLGSNDPAALYQPCKKSYRKLVKQADKLLSRLSVPCSIDDMSICRMDATTDLYFNCTAFVMHYIRTVQKGHVLLHYKRVYFKDKPKKAKDPREANRHSYRLECKTAAFFCYDKSAQLAMTGRLTDDLIDTHILRLEAELNRKAMKKFLGRQPDNCNYLKAGYKKAVQIILWYLKRQMKGMAGTYLRYSAAADAIEHQTWRKKTKERAQYLLRKTSDSETIDAAIRKTCTHFGLKDSAAKRLLRKLEKAGINPITLPNSAKIEEMPSLADLISHAL